MSAVVFFLVCATALADSVVIDRVAVIVGKTVIKSSDIQRDLRITEFLNREPLSFSADARRKAAERLIDQQVIRIELATGAYSRASDADAEAMLRRLEHDRYGGSEASFSAALERYGITRDELCRQLLWQLTVLRFIQQRFQPGVVVADQDVRTYYDMHLGELKRENPRNDTFAALEPKIRELLTGEAVNKDFEDWLGRARQRIHIEYRQGAFQ
jgi:hypothetical protein